MKLKVLLIDDKIPFLDIAVRFLNMIKNIELVSWALSGSDAVEKMNHFSFDLILIDLSLPDISGLELIRKIKALNEKQKIVVLTLLDDFEYRTEAQAAGADGFISKIEFVSHFNPLISELFDFS